MRKTDWICECGKANAKAARRCWHCGEPREKEAAPPDPRLAAYESIRATLDLPEDCEPQDVARAVEHVLSAQLAASPPESYPPRLPEIRSEGVQKLI